MLQVQKAFLKVSEGADLRCDLAQEPELAQALLGSADLIFLCLPEAAAVAVLPAISPYVGPEQLVVDICSVKTPITSVAEQYCLNAEYVSFHPMFGPDRPLEGSNGVFIPIRAREQAGRLRQFLLSLGLNLIDSDVETHDQVASMVQVIPHLLLITFAKLRSQMPVDEALVQAFSTPIFRDLEKVSQGLVRENPSLYHNIQNANPYADAARQLVQHALQSTRATVQDSDVALTEALFAAAQREWRDLS